MYFERKELMGKIREIGSGRKFFFLSLEILVLLLECNEVEYGGL